VRLRRPLRLLRRTLTVLGGLLLLIVALVGGLLWLTLPRGSQQAHIPGLAAPVMIAFDADGVPRIRAGSETDAAAALGLVHARDRMFQMELMRRAASGRLSEIAGPATLSIDRMMRTLGLRQRAVEDYAALPADTRAMLEAYARGVNAWIAERGRLAAPEFLLLGAPEPWSPVDSLLWGKTMALWLSSNWRTELSRMALSGHLPQSMIDELWPPSAAPGDPQASAAGWVRYADTAQRVLDALPRFPAPFTLPDTASNEWAVDGSHTATGAPLLAGDPHLAFGYPSIWYLARIDTPQGVLAGATAPGIPFLVLGHNGHIAWTFTTTGADTEDLFIETPTNDGKYVTPNGPQPFSVREERIKVRGAADVTLNVRETRHGPVISDIIGGTGQVLAVSMAALQPGDTAASGLYALNRAQDVAQAGASAAGITDPVQNLLVADRTRIALYMTGRVPIRRSGDGSAPVMGADGAHDWTGFASGEQLPHYLAPASGRLVNANERPAPPDFPVFLGRDWFGTWRAQRIRELLGKSDRHTPEDFATMQLDAQSVFARQLLPRLRAVPPPDGAAGRALALLANWDGSMAMDLPQPLIFTAWTDRIYVALLQHANVPLADGGPRAEFVAWALSPDGAHWCGGDCTPLARAALTDAVAALSAQFGPDPAAWRWGDAHQAVFAHPLLRAIPLLARLGTLTIASPGGDTTVDRGGTTLDGFSSVHGPEYRGVYDLANLDRSRFIMAPGQSGNLLSGHAGDFLLRWRDGATITLGPAVAETSSVIQLEP
jgi:penicillin amidase